MTKKQFKTLVQEYDQDLLAWWTPEETEELRIQFRTIEVAQKEGWLYYCHKDDLYFGPKTKNYYG